MTLVKQKNRSFEAIFLFEKVLKLKPLMPRYFLESKAC